MTRHIDQLCQAVQACEQAVRQHGSAKPLTKSLFNTVTALEVAAHDRRGRGTFDHPALPDLSTRVRALRQAREKAYKHP